MIIEESTPKDYVYAGQRLAKGKRYVEIVPIDPATGALEKSMWFAAKRDLIKSVGAVYRGACFSEGQALGIATARFETMWRDREDALRWEAYDAQALASLKQAKIEADSTRVAQIDTVLLPLRRIYSRALVRHDHAERARAPGPRRPVRSGSAGHGPTPSLRPHSADPVRSP